MSRPAFRSNRRAARGAALRERITAWLDRLHLCFAALLDLCIAHGVGMIESALRMDAGRRVGSFAAMWAESPGRMCDQRYRLENAHTTPNCGRRRQPRRSSATTTAHFIVVEDARAEAVNRSILDQISAEIRRNTAAKAICTGRGPEICNNDAGWYSERVSAAVPFCVGWLLRFQPHLLVGHHFRPLSLQPRK